MLLFQFFTSCKSQEYITPVGENLLNDGDFSTICGITGLRICGVNDSWVTQIELVDDNGDDVVMIINNDYNDAKIKQRVKVDEDSYYRLSGYIKAENVRDGSFANLSFENIFAYAGSLSDTNGEYQYVEMYGKTSKETGYINCLCQTRRLF